MEHEPEGTHSRKADSQDRDFITMAGQADLLADCQPKRKRLVKIKLGKRHTKKATQPKQSSLDPHDVVGSVMSHMDSTFGPPTRHMTMSGSGITFPAPTKRIPFLAPDDVRPAVLVCQMRFRPRIFHRRLLVTTSYSLRVKTQI